MNLFTLPELPDMDKLTPSIPGNTPDEIKANGEKILTEMDKKHQTEMKKLEEIHKENMKTLDEYFKAIDKATAEKDMKKVLELMNELNKVMNNTLL